MVKRKIFVKTYLENRDILSYLDRKHSILNAYPRFETLFFVIKEEERTVIICTQMYLSYYIHSLLPTCNH